MHSWRLSGPFICTLGSGFVGVAWLCKGVLSARASTCIAETAAVNRHKVIKHLLINRPGRGCIGGLTLIEIQGGIAQIPEPKEAPL